MAATIDKETLIKHRFWILSGCFLLLVLIPLLILGSSVSATVTKKEEDFHKQQGDLQKITSAKNQSVVDALKDVDSLVDKKKTQVWAKAWQQQGPIIETFPAEMEATFAGKRFGDSIPEIEADRFTQYYQTQLPELYDLVQPLEGRLGIVQFGGGAGREAWNNVVQLSRKFKEGTPPTKEDIWLAQEDLWVKRELLRVIREANDAVAVFTEIAEAPPVNPAKKDAKPAASAEADKKEPKAGAAAESGKNEPKPAAAAESAPKETKAAPAPVPFKTKPGIPAHKRFQNPFWELDLTLKRDGRRHVLSGKITNITKHRQALGVTFMVLLQDLDDHPQPSATPVQVNRDPLAAGESATLEFGTSKEKIIEDNLAIDGLFGVEQVLTWRTAPVKRLDRVELYWNSSRTATDRNGAPRGLKPPQWLAKSLEGSDTKDPALSGGNTGGSEGLSGMQKFMQGGSGGAGAGFGLGGGLSGDGATTKNGLVINRYTDTTDQVRHMPVGLVVVADEDLIPYFLGAFANSRLRIQTTQCHWTHFRHKIAPSLEEESSPGPNKPKGQGGDGIPGKFGIGGPLVRGGAAGPAGGGSGAYNAAAAMMRQGPSSLERMKQMGTGARTVATPSSSAFGPGLLGPVQGSFKATEEDEEDMNLVRVAVYGIASLYERYPPKPPSTGDANTEVTKP